MRHQHLQPLLHWLLLLAVRRMNTYLVRLWHGVAGRRCCVRCASHALQGGGWLHRCPITPPCGIATCCGCQLWVERPAMRLAGGSMGACVLH